MLACFFTKWRTARRKKIGTIDELCEDAKWRIAIMDCFRTYLCPRSTRFKINFKRSVGSIGVCRNPHLLSGTTRHCTMYMLAQLVFSPTVLIKCSICTYSNSLTRAPPEMKGSRKCSTKQSFVTLVNGDCWSVARLLLWRRLW